MKRRPLERVDLERMALPEEFWRVRLPGLPEPAAAIVTNYIARMPALFEKGVGLLFSGLMGTGKTSLASIVAREARVRGYSVYFTAVWGLREGVRTRAMFDPEQTVMERALQVDLLVLDNLRPEDSADMFLGRRALDELVTARASANRPTLLTTRVPFTDLDDPKGLWWGLPQLGRLVCVTVKGPDLRDVALKALKTLVVGAAQPPLPTPTPAPAPTGSPRGNR